MTAKSPSPVLVLLAALFMGLIGSLLIHRIQGTIGDEYAALPQIQSFLAGDWSVQENLAVPPVYHALVAVLARLLGIHSLDGLRLLSLALSLPAVAVFYFSARKMDADSAVLRTLQFLYLPILLPYLFILYTDPLSLLLLLLALCLALHDRPGLAGLAALLDVVVRQNQIVWVGWLFGWLYLREQRKWVFPTDPDEAKSAAGNPDVSSVSRDAEPRSGAAERVAAGEMGPLTSSGSEARSAAGLPAHAGVRGSASRLTEETSGLFPGIVRHLVRCWSFCLVFLAFLAFLVINRGLTLGQHEDIHRPGLYVGNVLFALFLCSFLLLPIFLVRLPRALALVLRHPWILAGVGLLFLLCLEFQVRHSMNDASRNPDFPRNHLLALATTNLATRDLFFLPIALAGLSLAALPLHERASWTLYPFWVLSVLPIELIEQRYSLAGVTLLLLFRKMESEWLEWVQLGWFVAWSLFLLVGISRAWFFL